MRSVCGPDGITASLLINCAEMLCILKNTQHGFRGGLSCLSTLSDVYDNVMHMIDYMFQTFSPMCTIVYL